MAGGGTRHAALIASRPICSAFQCRRWVEIGDMGAMTPLVRCDPAMGVVEGVEWDACGSWQINGGQSAVTLIGELIEVIARRAGLEQRRRGRLTRSRSDAADGNSDASEGGPSSDQVRALLDVIGFRPARLRPADHRRNEEDDRRGRTRSRRRVSATAVRASPRPARHCSPRSPTTAGTAPDRARTPTRTPGSS